MHSVSRPRDRVGPSSITESGQLVPARPRTTEEFDKPVVTSKWWTAALWSYQTDVFCESLYPHPLALQPMPHGLGLCYPTRLQISDDTRMYSYPYEEDLCVGLQGLESSDVRVVDYSDWTATLRWAHGASRLQAIAGHGLPYVYFERSGSSPALVRVAGKPDVWLEGSDTLAVTVRERHYALFGPSGSCWVRIGPKEWINDLAGRTHWSAAILPGRRSDTLEDFRRHAHVVITDSKVDWRYDEATATVRSRYTVATQAREGEEQQPLLALYPHQWKHSRTELTDHRFGSPRGIMKVVRTREFFTELPVPGLLPMMPTPDNVNRQRLWQLIDDVGSQGGEPLWPQPLETDTEDDAYWSGKALGRLAHLAELANAIGHDEARERFLTVIRNKLACFFDGTDEPCFHYDATWRSLIFYPAAAHGLDTRLNDHQYAYGYYLKAVVTLLRLDRDWWHRGDNAAMVVDMIRDVANHRRDDPRFPFLRHFDVYAGHSWGSGAACYDAGMNAEPSSEAIQFAHGVALVGLHLCEPELRDLGLYLAASEIAAAEQYWFDVDGDVFPHRYAWPVAGIVWGGGARYGAWWSDSVDETHGVNMVPMQAGALYLARHPGHARRIHACMHELARGLPRRWQDIHLMYQSLYDPSSALAAYAANPDLPTEWGNSAALLYHWLQALNGVGVPEATVWADVPCHQVFSKDGQLTYTAYNPGPQILHVRFSDGTELDVEPRSIAVTNGSNPLIEQTFRGEA